MARRSDPQPVARLLHRLQLRGIDAPPDPRRITIPRWTLLALQPFSEGLGLVEGEDSVAVGIGIRMFLQGRPEPAVVLRPPLSEYFRQALV
jgi:hypothetical protein